MPQVPIYNQPTVRNQRTPQGYNQVSVNADMAGENIARANYVLARMGENVSDNIKKHIDQLAKTKIVEATNKLDTYAQQTLYDKDNGYFYKTGKNAAGQAPVIMQDYDNYAKQVLDESGLSGSYKSQALNAINSKRNQVFIDVNAHDVEQTKIYQNNVYTEKTNNIITQAILHRNDNDFLAKNKQQGLNAIELQAQTLNWDDEKKVLETTKFLSQYNEKVIGAFLADGSLKAKPYYEAHKSEILPDRHNSILNAVNNNEKRYQARSLANQIINSSKSERESIEKAEAIQDPELSDMTVSRVKRHYSDEEHFKSLEQREALDEFYEKAVQAKQTGSTLPYDAIPDNVDPETKLSLMNYINTKGQPETDNQVWETLYDMSVNNAQGFAKEDLNKYRGYLSDGEYKNFLKKQQDIQAGGYYTTIKDDDRMIKAALKTMGLNSDGKTASAFSEIRAMTRELEARKGRKITDAELQNLTNSLGYKGEDGVQLYKLLERGMSQKVGFMRDVMNDFIYHQSKHNGEMPSDSEKMKIINNRLYQKVQEKKTYAQQSVDRVKYNALTMRNIAYTNPKPNEQKVLTYFADNQIPAIEKKLGIKLTITSRYRNQPGSKHYEGRAADVSMSEHSPQNRIRIYEEILPLPDVQAIGVSDPVILAHFAGNRKIVDERRYDKQHGTNHVNHAHVTLINANPARPAAPVNNVSRNNVYSF